MSVVIVTGAIAPYTNRLYDEYGCHNEMPLHVLTCTQVEPHRQWQIPKSKHYTLQVLKGFKLHRNNVSHVYFQASVWGALKKIQPKLIILDGFSPTMMLAGIYARRHKIPLGIMTDGTDESDPGEHSRVHKWMRQFIIPKARLGLGASEGSKKLLVQYGLSEDKFFELPILTNWDKPDCWRPRDEREYDVLFCGSLNDEIKGVFFFERVVKALKARQPDLKVRVTGDGPKREELERNLRAADIDVQFDGFVQSDRTMDIFSSAKLFLFPSRGEAWGLVSNESILCGTPVIATPFAASGHYLVEKFEAGYVLPLVEKEWVEKATNLLDDEKEWHRLQANHAKAAKWFDHEKVLATFEKALEFGMKN